MKMRQIAEDVLRERYLRPGDVDFEGICDRVVNHIFPQDRDMRVKSKEAMMDLRFLPNTPTLINSGTDIGQLNACFVLGIEDNMPSIFETLKNAALIFQSGGGVGINFSYLRPKGAPVGSTLGTSSGVLSFMQVYNSMVETVKSGAVRRGAAIGILNCSHPEIEEFVESKNTEGQLSNFNISVMITDSFMDAVKHDLCWDLKFDGVTYKTINARGLYNKISQSMWTRAEPGILYFDSIQKDNILHSVYGDIDTTNPCGEKPLIVERDSNSEYNCGGSSCTLGSLNLTKYPEDGHFNFDRFERDINLAVEFLDNIIDINKYPLKSIEHVSKDVREIGLGVMGYHDMLIMMGIPYDSDKAYELESRVFETLYQTAVLKSEQLGKDKGYFPCCCDTEIVPRRNSFLISVAPTGTLSLIAGVSSGIEPNFSYVYNRSTTSSGEKVTYREVHPLFDEYVKTNHPAYYDEIINYMFENGTLQGCPNFNNHAKELFKTAKDISWKDHVKTLATAQVWVDSSISKTINCPAETTKEEIGELIKYAWESGCKGLTIYREGSRENVVLETNATKKVEEKTPQSHNIIQLPKMRDSKTFDCKSACGDIRVTVTYYQDSPIEVFVNAGDTGGCKANIEAIGRLASTAMRAGIPYEAIVDQLHKIDCPACKKGNSDGKSCADIIGKQLVTAAALKASEIGQLERSSRLPKDPLFTIKNVNIPDGLTANDVIRDMSVYRDVCPDCGAQLIHTDGCKSCTCGFTKCQ